MARANLALIVRQSHALCKPPAVHSLGAYDLTVAKDVSLESICFGKRNLERFFPSLTHMGGLPVVVRALQQERGEDSQAARRAVQDRSERAGGQSQPRMSSEAFALL